MKNIDFGIDIKQLQRVELEILLELDRICRKHHIQYQLFSGTLLGAVRHKGFIPWDDDIDVCMLRKDYNKFINICNEELDEIYFLQNHETDPEYIHSFARIRKENTLLIQKAWADIKMHHGIFIDIFPMDKILPNRFIGKLQYHTIYFLRKVKKFKRKKVCLNASSFLKKQIKLFIHVLLKPISLQCFNRLETKVACIFKNKETIYSTCLSEGAKEVYHNYMIKNKEFYDTVNIDFEGYKLPIPRSYDEVLTSNFGDYMTPPPIEEQKPHHGIIKLNFDTTISAKRE